MLNFADLYTAVQGLMERSDSNMLVRIKAGLNAGNRSITAKRPWYALLRQTTFNGRAGLDYFITDQNVDQIIDISQRQTPILLGLQRYAALLSRNVDIIGTTGAPVIATPSGEIGVLQIPVNSSFLISSNSTLDITQMVRITGYQDTIKTPLTEVIILNGTTGVGCENDYSFEEGYEPHFTKDADTAGDITISDGLHTVAQLARTEREARYKKWKVWPVFNTNLLMYLTFKKRIHQLVNDEDTPDLECDNALIQYAFAYCLREKRQMTKAKEVFGIVDQNGSYPPGTYMFELEQMIANEPQFSENFTDQLLPVIDRESIDNPTGQTGFQLWPSS